MFTNWSVGRITYVTQLQLTMAVVMAFGCIVLALHGYIARAFPSNAAEINPKVIAKAQRLAQRKERQHSGRSSSGVRRAPQKPTWHPDRALMGWRLALSLH